VNSTATRKNACCRTGRKKELVPCTAPWLAETSKPSSSVSSEFCFQIFVCCALKWPGNLRKDLWLSMPDPRISSAGQSHHLMMDGKSSAASRARRYACNLILHFVICALEHFWCGLFYHLSNSLCSSLIFGDSHQSLLALPWIGLWQNWKQIFSTSGSEWNQKQIRLNPLNQ